MDINEKTVGQLIDELITTNIRTWFNQEKLMDNSLSESERLKEAINAQCNNKRRNSLIRAIDKSLEQSENSPAEKTY
jgi:hypothetical protein